MFKLDFGIKMPTRQEYEGFLELASKAPYLTVDTESDPDADGLFLGMSIAIGGAPQLATYFPMNLVNDEYNIDEYLFKEVIDVVQATPFRVFQHAGHDLMVFEDLGYPMDGRLACTLIMAHMVNENLIAKDLDHLHKHYCNGIGKDRPDVMQNIIDTFGWRFVPGQLMYQYGKQDAVATGEVFEVLRPMYEREFGKLFND